MPTKLKPKYEFTEQASKKIKKGMSLEEAIEFSQGFNKVTEEEVTALYNSLVVLSPYQKKQQAEGEAMKMAKAELEIRYNNLDVDFLKKYENIVLFQRGENVTFYNYESGVYNQILDVELEYLVDEFMVDSLLFAYRTKTRVRDVIGRISATLSRTKGKVFKEEHIQRQKYYLNVKNGLLDMTTFELIPHSKDYFSTCQATYEYNPEATAPEFENFINTVSNEDEDTVKMLRDMFGYVVGSKRNSRHKVFYLYGETARNGKSTTAKLLCNLLGKENYSTISIDQLTSNKSSILAALVGKHLNFIDEAPSKYIESSILTTLSAEGIMLVDPKYKPAYMHMFSNHWLLTCNDQPRFRDSQGMYHRAISIPFNYQIPEGERIERYDEVLLEKEGSGILNWAIESIKRFRESNTFTINEQSRLDSYENKMQSNSVFAYLEESFDFDKDFIEELSLDEMYGSKKDRDHNGTGYNLYCFVSGLKDVSRPNFAKELRRYASESKKITIKRKSDGMYYTGLRMKPSKPGPFDELTGSI